MEAPPAPGDEKKVDKKKRKKGTPEDDPAWKFRDHIDKKDRLHFSKLEVDYKREHGQVSFQVLQCPGI